MDRAQCLQILMSVYFSIKIIHGQSAAANLLPGFKKLVSIVRIISISFIKSMTEDKIE